MKIKGIAGKNHPTIKRGDVIELSPEEKVEAMAKIGLTDSSPEGYMYIPLSAKAVGDVQVIIGKKDTRNPEPDQYIGIANVRFRTCKLATDRVFVVKTQKVKVHCKDVKDALGLTDLDLIEATLLK